MICASRDVCRPKWGGIDTSPPASRVPMFAVASRSLNSSARVASSIQNKPALNEGALHGSCFENDKQKRLSQNFPLTPSKSVPGLSKRGVGVCLVCVGNLLRPPPASRP